MPGSVNCTFINDVVWHKQQALHSAAPQRDTIYIWHGLTNELLHLYTDYYALLNAEEQIRAANYSQLADRQRYVIEHGLLRLLLGWYLKTTVFEGTYVYGHHGKPYLPDHDIQSCFFNLSSSVGEFVIAVGDRELGVDIEYLNTGFNYQDIFFQYFGTDERAFITGSENPDDAFFLLWTRKEALLKATGKGVDDDLLLIPALNGKHALPDNYNDVDWLTTSFRTGNNSMMSITYLSSPVNIQLIRLRY